MSKPSAIIRDTSPERAARRWTCYADWFYRPRRGGGNRLFTGAASPGDVIDRCQGYGTGLQQSAAGDPALQFAVGAAGRTPWIRYFITTSSLQHLPVLERALASGISRIVVEEPIVANLEQAARLRALLAPPEQAARVLALDHWMARGVALNASWPAVAGGEGRPAACRRRTCQRRISSGSKVICRSQAALTALVSRSHSILPPGSWIPGSCVTLMG